MIIIQKLCRFPQKTALNQFPYSTKDYTATHEKNRNYVDSLKTLIIQISIPDKISLKMIESRCPSESSSFEMVVALVDSGTMV
jgi:hypothetical protein